MTNMAWAEGAVIIKDDGKHVTYHPRCPYCGSVQQNVTSSAYVSGGVTNAASISCNKCGKRSDIRFGRS